MHNLFVPIPEWGAQKPVSNSVVSAVSSTPTQTMVFLVLMPTNLAHFQELVHIRFISNECFVCLYICAPHTWSVPRGWKRVSDPWYWSYRRLWPITWMLGTKPDPSPRAASNLNCWGAPSLAGVPISHHVGSRDWIGSAELGASAFTIIEPSQQPSLGQLQFKFIPNTSWSRIWGPIQPELGICKAMSPNELLGRIPYLPPYACK